MVALGNVSLVTHFSLNWRLAFWIGAGIAVIGSVARTRLRETPEFLGKTRKLKKKVEAETGKNQGFSQKILLTQKLINRDKIARKTFWLTSLFTVVGLFLFTLPICTLISL